MMIFKLQNETEQVNKELSSVFTSSHFLFFFSILSNRTTVSLTPLTFFVISFFTKWTFSIQPAHFTPISFI